MKRNIKQQFINCMMYFSIQEREKREHLRYIQNYTELDNLTESELMSLHVTTQIKYKSNGRIFSLIVVSLFMFGLPGIWQVFNCVKQILDLSHSGPAEADAAITAFSLILISILFIFFLFLIVIIFQLSELSNLNKKMLMIEEIKNTRTDRPCQID